MTGFFLFGVMGLWIAAVLFVTRVISRKLPKQYWRIPLSVVLFGALVPLPFIDEIVGGRQFEQLCKDNSTIQVDRATAVGKSVYLAQTPDVEVKGTWVRVVLQPRRFVDAATRETVVSFNNLVAVGGRFIQTLGISEGGVPLTFKGWCQPGDQYTLEELFKELQITLIRRPEKSNGETK